MKKQKLTSLIFLSIALLFLSLAGAFVFGYFYFYKNQKANKSDIGEKTNVNLITNDSSTQAYNSADTTSISLANNHKEYEQLKNQISSLIEVASDSTPVSQEIQQELQQKLEALRMRNNQVAEESRNFNLMLNSLAEEIKQLNKRVATKPPATIDTATVVQPKEETKPALDKIVASDLRVNAYNVSAGRETETSDAAEARRIECSAWVENNGNKRIDKDVIVELRKPGGGLLQRSKSRFTAIAGGIMKIKVLMPVNNLQGGNYSVKFLLNGQVIGSARKHLK